MINKNWHKFYISSGRGPALSALFCPGSTKHPGTGDPGQKPVIVVCHGFTGSKEGGGRAVDMAERLADYGFSTLLFDFAGCGESEGRWENISLSGQIADIGTVSGWCRREGFEKIILNGRSFGGTTALCYAPQDKNVDAVCTWAAVARPKDLFEKRAACKNSLEGSPDQLITLEGEEGAVSVRRSFFYDLNKNDPLESAAALAPRRLLIIHGSADQSVPLEDAGLLYNRAKEPKKLVIIENADHRFSEHLDQVWNAFFSWLGINNPQNQNSGPGK